MTLLSAITPTFGGVYQLNDPYHLSSKEQLKAIRAFARPKSAIVALLAKDKPIFLKGNDGATYLLMDDRHGGDSSNFELKLYFRVLKGLFTLQKTLLERVFQSKETWKQRASIYLKGLKAEKEQLAPERAEKDITAEILQEIQEKRKLRRLNIVKADAVYIAREGE